MSNINVHGHMARKSVTRDLQGNIINWIDESDGGWIIRNRQVVNQRKLDEYAQREKDRREAAKAVAEQRVDHSAPDRTAAPSKVDALEKRMDATDAKLDAILAALKK